MYARKDAWLYTLSMPRNKMAFISMFHVRRWITPVMYVTIVAVGRCGEGVGRSREHGTCAICEPPGHGSHACGRGCALTLRRT